MWDWIRNFALALPSNIFGVQKVQITLRSSTETAHPDEELGHRLPADLLHEIFVLALPTSYPRPYPVDDNSTSIFFASTVPHNVSRVCHSWRNLALSSTSLWSTFFFSFYNPSDQTLKLLTRFIEQHLRRSHHLPLMSFIRLEGTYNLSLPQAIVPLMSVHQSRWRRVGIWFETLGANKLAVVCDIPVPRTQLFIEDLTLLEELHVSFSTEYTISSSTGRALRNSLHSLTHLHLHTRPDSREAMRWLELTPNLKELNINYGPSYSDDYGTRPPYSSSYEIVMVDIGLLVSCVYLFYRSIYSDVPQCRVRFVVQTWGDAPPYVLH